jgi:hypothetical protein
MPSTSRPADKVTWHFNVPIGGTGAQTLNVFKVHGSVRVIEQYAEIIEATTLTNCTAVYADLYDGTNTVDLTANGATLSGAPVGTIFTRDKVATQPYSVSVADQCRMSEVLSTPIVGLPFTVTQKNGADTYIRFHYTTTDAPIDFVMLLRFCWSPVDGGYLEIV